MITHRILGLFVVTAMLMVMACAPEAELIPSVEPTVAQNTPPSATQTPTAEPTLVPTATHTIVPTLIAQPTPAATEIPVYLPFTPGKFVHPTNPNLYFVFREGGRWANYIGGTQAASGTYQVEGDLYIQLSNSHGCPRTSFKYTFDGKFLKFQLTDESRNDTCGDRKDFYNNKTYILEP